uniref:Uncharacterized protein n=1 Tax=Odontella aurita TaxID=265563 RepID=A0A7S4NHK7_9STRA|mmetsp:Transcript_765/g.2228  ORF Transcript_765/g.2228 Transcript_765/m.2228 type:complete len:161 (+) Transcript_765:409-891(+)|eukprot:CAMPEP_0113556666 /NCGR_PEP_ID=MMETSP0015_2-20120614/17372_1 /TAXON_ID=2838 /ORGANISM="Odontella" /LENGTH=160 /DNA_ID=CAMNT_0000458025 /DNA_START=349 /DNA_END=831 /DNA_ORIENTATION=+ /assembly_acc=CAM_ASM_000160
MSSSGNNFEFVIPPSPQRSRRKGHRRQNTDGDSKCSSMLSGLQGLNHLDSFSTRRSEQNGDDFSLSLTVTTTSSAPVDADDIDYDPMPEVRASITTGQTQSQMSPVTPEKPMRKYPPSTNAEGEEPKLPSSTPQGRRSQGGGKQKSALHELFGDFLCGCV